LIDSGAGILNESCGVESNPIRNSSIWIFQVEKDATTPATDIDITTETTAMQTTEQSTIGTTEEPAMDVTERSAVKTTEQAIIGATEEPTVKTTEKPTVKTTEQSVTTQTSSPSQVECPQWFQFNRISNESTSLAEPNFTFCFTVETTFADVTIGANTWSPCTTWKLSSTADPFMELYTEPSGVLLAQNDDGNSLPLQNCYAAILSYRLQRGDYRVVIRSSRCAYGKFELRLTTEINGNL